jgi:hypothetical protein
MTPTAEESSLGGCDAVSPSFRPIVVLHLQEFLLVVPVDMVYSLADLDV